MDLLRETLELIQDTAKKAQAAQLIDLPGDGRTRWLCIGGELKAITIPPAVRKHRVESLEDLAMYAQRNAAEHPQCGQAVVWHDSNAVWLVLDDSDRRDTVTFHLTPSEPFMVLTKLRQAPAWLDQREFISMLRISLGLDNIGVIDQFRRLDWKSTSESNSTIGHGRESLGKSIQAEVQGVEKLPDELDVRVPVFANPGVDEEYVISCAIEIDARNERICLVPLPGELERAARAAQNDIEHRLVAALSDIDVPVYFGTP